MIGRECPQQAYSVGHPSFTLQDITDYADMTSLVAGPVNTNVPLTQSQLHTVLQDKRQALLKA